MGTKKEKAFCAHCGASMIEHREILNRGLVRGLIRLAERGRGPVNLRVLDFTRSQWQNFSKLSFWGFVRKVGEQKKGGRWQITTEGIAFLSGANTPKVLWTYRGATVRHEDACVTIRSMLPGYRYRADYAADAVPHGDDSLFQ